MRPLFCTFLLFSACGAVAQSGPLDTRGREFWLGFMQNASGTQQLSVKVASEQATTGTVSVPLAGWSTSFSVPANGVVSVSIPTIYESIGSETVQDRGVRITSVEPITVTAVNYQNQTTDASQVLPVNSLGTSYRVEALPGTSTAFQNGQFIFRSEFMVVATQDGTEVRITPSVGTTAGHAPNVPFTVSLDAGQTYQVQALSGLTNLTGTLIESTDDSGPCRPFAVFGGSMCAVVNCAACDHVNEQMIPVNTWGTSFHTVSLGNLSAFGYRILAGEDGTSVTIDGGAPIVLNAGQAHEVLNTTQSVCIGGSNPISVTQIMEGATCAGNGDPSLLMMVPDDRMSTTAVFATLYSTQAVVNHFVSIVTPTGATAQLMLDGTPVAPALFTTYAACPGFSQAKVQVSPGTHTLASAAGFIAYAYGMASGESYMYGLSNNMAEPIEADTVICASGPITLASPIVLANAQWTMASDPLTVLATGNSFTFTPDHNDVYRVDGELSPSGCPQHFEFQVGLPVNPQLDLLANGAVTDAVCQFSSVQLGVGSVLDAQWFDLNWSPSAQLTDPSIPNPVAYPSTSTWYKLQVTSPMGCGTAVDSVLVTVNPSEIFAVRATTVDDTICAGNPTSLHAEVEHVLYADAFEGTWAPWWQNVQGASTSSACGSVTGTALYFNGAGMRSATTPGMDLTLGGMLHFALKIASGAPPCDDVEPGEDIVLEYSTNGSTWTALATFQENAYPSFTQVDAAVPPLGAAGANAQLRLRQLANSGAGQDNWSLDNLIITRYEDASGQMAWTPASSLDAPATALPTATPAQDTWYKVEVVNASGCTYVDSVRVAVAPAFSIVPISDTTRCGAPGTQLNAQATSGTGISWSWSPALGLNAANIANPVASPSASTTYTVSASSSLGCTDTETVAVGVSGMTSVSASASEATLCYGEEVELTAGIVASAPYSISWAPAAVVADPTLGQTMAAPVDTTAFVCTVTDTQTGCFMNASSVVNVNPPYAVELMPDTTVCSALGLQLNVSHNLTAPFLIAWSPAGQLNAANIASPTIMADTTTTYVVTLTDQSGCTVTDSTTISVAFDNLVTPVNMSACAGETLVLDAGFPGSTYTWSTNASTQSISVAQSGQYGVTITDVQACQVVKTFYVTFNPLPVVSLGPDLALCGETEHQIDAGNAGNAVLWNTGSQAQQLTVTTSGTYSVTVTTPAGCQASDAMEITLNPLPVDALQDISVCEDAPIMLDAGNAGSTYAWSTGESGQTILPGSSGTYSVTVTTPEQCSAQFEAEVALMPLVDVDLGPDLVRCEGEPVVLGHGALAADLLWSTGATTPTLDVDVSGTYILAATNGYCADSDTVQVLFNPAPVNNLSDQTACIGQTITLDAGNPGSTYAWSNGGSAGSTTVATAGQYAVAITGANGCEASFSAEVAFVPPPVVDLGADTVLCANQVLVLDAGNPGNTFQWNTGSVLGSINVISAGTYSVDVDNGYCSTSDSILVLFNPVPQRMPTHEFFICLDDEPHYVEISAGNPGSSFLWDGGQASSVIHATEYGWYGVQITNVFGCSIADSALVNEFCRPTLFIPNAFTPNGDGRNDVWMPVGNNIGAYEMYVFDRWGGVIFHTTEVNNGWDGTMNGDALPNDVYAFRVTFRLIESTDGHLGFEQVRMGHVQVVR